MNELLDAFVQVPIYLKLLLIFWAVCLIGFIVAYPFALTYAIRDFFGLNKKDKPSKF